LHTVCQSAHCPNIGECWQRRTATVMILGNTCTRNCRYCSVPSGKPGTLDPEEPQHVAEAIQRMGLRHAVITSVTRDDLADGGTGHFAETVRWVRILNPDTTVEVLTPDFNGNCEQICTVAETEPEVFGHNIETVGRLYPVLRGCRYSYHIALQVLKTVSDLGLPSIVKSAIMVGHGETQDEVKQTLEDLLEVGCEAVNIGQYLRPTQRQREVVGYVHPEQFELYEELAYQLGFRFALAGPFVRSSYRSEEIMSAPFVRERMVAARRG
ncbi:MAG: lipoyl synthase, partial [Candidatus Hydrogenedentes bacterium]|nr:lipoyl synthase [Candidatus Hydrogenedentota bacterium]